MSPFVLWRYIGHPQSDRWKAVLAEAGIELKWAPIKEVYRGNRRAGLTHKQCRRVMEIWYAGVGERRLRRWRAA